MSKKKYVDPNGECIVCGFIGVDIHHILSRGSQGKAIDEKWNLAYLCHSHHQELHQVGINRFADTKYGFRKFLKENGWEKNDLGKWFMPYDKR